MNEVQRKTAEAILQICRNNGVTLEELLICAIKDNITNSTTTNNEEQSGVDIEKQVASILKEFGIPANIKGYQYAKEAIMYVLQHEEVIHSITKGLYPPIAKKFGTTISGVDRAIRHAIEVGWGRGNMDLINQYFGYTIKFKKGMPTNSEFIATLVDNIKLANKV